MIPLRDANPTLRTPVVTLALIAACVLVFGVELLVSADGGDRALDRFFREWGAIPAAIDAALQKGDYASDATLGAVTSIFLHGGWLHLLGNMLFLWIFGNNIEDRLGRPAFVAFYFAGGLAAAFAQVLIDPASTIPLVGASGAIAACLGAYFVLYPRARITSLVFLGFWYQLAEVPALLVLGYWFVLQLVDGVASLGATSAEGGVAFFAHIGGFVAGLLVGALIRTTRYDRRRRGGAAAAAYRPGG